MGAVGIGVGENADLAVTKPGNVIFPWLDAKGNRYVMDFLRA